MNERHINVTLVVSHTVGELDTLQHCRSHNTETQVSRRGASCTKALHEKRSLLQKVWATISVAMFLNDKQCRQTTSLLALLKPI